MPPTDNCVAVIPCLNEEAEIAALVRSVRQPVRHVLVVDDGSSDQTSARAREAGADVIRHERPLGKGRSLIEGWQVATERGFTWAITLDGDGQHAPANIPAFLQQAEVTGAPLLIGNRMSRPDTMPPLRQWINRWLSMKISELTGRDLPDSQCGFRLVHLPTLAALPLRAEHFEIESEMIFQFARHGHAIGFVPIDVIYAAERSKIRPLLDTVRWWKWYFRARRELAKAAGAGQPSRHSLIEQGQNSPHGLRPPSPHPLGRGPR
jgi:glycosyltransferase involved in cell wall biosynthesis